MAGRVFQQVSGEKGEKYLAFSSLGLMNLGPG